MVPITLDISETIQEFSMNQEQAQGLASFLIESIATEYMDAWEKTVDSELTQTQDVYKSAMKVEYPDYKSCVFILEGKGDRKMALMLEMGVSPFDMKDGFSRSSKRKKSKTRPGGWFLHVPFRLATAQALATSNIFSGQMPKPIENLAKNLPGKSQLKIADIPEEFQIKGMRKEIVTKDTIFPAYVHKSTMYEGIQHSPKQNHGQYVKFRTVANTEGQEMAWVHPGFKEYNLMGKAMEKIKLPILFSRSIDQYLQGTQ
jgi:hypothetical protein